MPVPAGGDGSMSDLYVDLDTVKALLSKDSVDDRDDLITMSIRAACRLIDKRTGRRFWADDTPVTRTYATAGRSYYDRNLGRYQLIVPDIADTTGLAVALGRDPAWTPLTGYDTGPDNATLTGQPITRISNVGGWGAELVQVTARWGFPAVPDDVHQAAALMAARLHRRADSPYGVIGNGDFGPVRVSRLDPDVEALIADYILPGFA